MSFAIITFNHQVETSWGKDPWSDLELKRGSQNNSWLNIRNCLLFFSPKAKRAPFVCLFIDQQLRPSVGRIHKTTTTTNTRPEYPMHFRPGDGGRNGIRVSHAHRSFSRIIRIRIRNEKWEERDYWAEQQIGIKNAINQLTGSSSSSSCSNWHLIRRMSSREEEEDATMS